MCRIKLDGSARRELQHRSHAPGIKPRTRDRLEMVRLGDSGWGAGRIAEHLGMCVGTVRTWLKAFLRAGFDALADKEHTGPPSALSPEILEAVRVHLPADGCPHTSAEFAGW